DFGAVSVGDPTVDLHGAWEILDGPARDVFAHELGVGEPEWLRGRAWALGIALCVLPYYWTSMPDRRDDRLAIARTVLATCECVVRGRAAHRVGISTMTSLRAARLDGVRSEELRVVNVRTQ